MRVLMVSSHNMGGRFFEDFAKGAMSSEIELGFMWLSQDKPPKWFNQFRIINLNNRFLESRSFFLQCIGGAYATYRFKPHLIQTHLFRAGILGIILGKIMRKPTILTRHHITEHVEAGSKFHRVMDRFSAMTSDFVIVFSVAAKKWLIETEKINPKKIFVINQGFDFQKLSPSLDEIQKVRKQLGFSKRSFNLVCVSRYSETKGQKFLVQAIYELLPDIPEIKLVFIGPGERTWLDTFVQELELEEYIHLEAYRTDIPACLAAADLVVHPSLVDSFSQLLIEAQGVGVPLIATDIAAAREQIIDGVTGIIVKERDPSELAAAIKQLYLNREFMAQLGLNAIRSVRERFSVERLIQETQDCYLQVTAQS